LRLTQTDLAGLVGASRVRVNQILGYYRKRGNAAVNKDHRVTVHDEEAPGQPRPVEMSGVLRI
jgi:CRP/FNR family transcriptional regulator, cyclic AMP receptor protein